jgi:RNA polymerase sigma-70 factor (ECF subfamily)
MQSISNEEFAEQRRYLLRFAQLHLRDHARAEDVVQETLAAALEQGERFSGGSSVRTWLTGILKHKIIDVFRAGRREKSVSELGDDAEDGHDPDALFDAAGHWQAPPSSWGDPSKTLEQKRFMETLEKCNGGLPDRLAQVFTLREVMGLTTEEICAQLGITPNNCNVMLYRARMGLRDCLEKNWFAGGGKP